MTSQADLSARLSEVIGTPIVRIAAIGGGTFGQPFRVTAQDGVEYFAKVGSPDHGPALSHEAKSLGWLAEASTAGGVPVASVVASFDDLLVLDWIPAGTATAATAAEFGRGLAITHAAGADRFGGTEHDFIASEPLPAGCDYDDWPAFYAGARLAPFLERAAHARSISTEDRQSVQAVIERITDLAGPAEPPARLHGDLWSGNVLWTRESAVVIDPSAHAGHRETDLAMLTLFGLPHLDLVIDSYQQTRPLAEGWQQRVSLHQIYPLLVHASLFNGHYGRTAGTAARRALAAADG